MWNVFCFCLKAGAKEQQRYSPGRDVAENTNSQHCAGCSLTVIWGNIMKVCFVAAIAALSLSCSAQAAVMVQNSELPSAVQSQFGSVSFSSFNTTNMAAFGYMENSVAKWLIRYNVLPPSYYTNASGGSSTTSPVSGYLWLSANNQYDLTNGNRPAFTLFTEKSSQLRSTQRSRLR